MLSEMEFFGLIAHHHLIEASVVVGGETHLVNLPATDRPILQQNQIPAAINQENQLDIGEHGFTLRYGSIAAAGFTAHALKSRGLGERANDLGAALAESTFDGISGNSGCTGVSSIICREIGEVEMCVAAGCVAAIPALDLRFTSWWRELDGAGLDFMLTGTTPIYDFDNDLMVDSIGVDGDETQTGNWGATFTLASELSVETVGGFGTSAELPE